MDHVTCLGNIDISQLQTDLELLLADVLMCGTTNQLSITSVSGDDDWDCSVGKIHRLAHPERFYSKLNKRLKGTAFETVVDAYPQYYRWRLMLLPGNTNYSIHSDSSDPNKLNKRIHIPIVTNPGCYMIFFGTDQTKHLYHMEAGSVYEADTTGMHSAINFGNTNRYHLVGVRYENRNNRS
jgi:hypothetical protein